ncbi:PhzF family phenazine biosynthesis protein [Luteimonas sp. Y-2-2-4F]|nr:PhzF family phenazine biosynthesis protein [Luteimonas sp. Y-2-2-4F]MCD9032300.1 PhzF family phenazine biosynthesis protein [Luteimonas sp. Y-2-2-4F]
MPRLRYLQLDVFAPRRGLGNPLGAVFGGEALDAGAMQAIAAWLNLSETVFFLPPGPGADYRVRIFTPGAELPFAGHPSVGAAWAAVETGLCAPRQGRLVQACAAGLLPVRIGEDAGRRTAAVRSPEAQHLPTTLDALPDALAAAAAAGEAAELWSNGPHWWLLEVRDDDALQALRPDLPAIAALPGGGKLAAYAVDPVPGDGVSVRAFAPGVGVPEDPVTGSVNALIASRLRAQGRLPGAAGRYVARQGRALGRDGRIAVEVDADGAVWIGGDVQPVIEGRLDW